MKIHFAPTAVVPYGPAPAGEEEALARVELCGRTAYKSEHRITPDSAVSFVKMLKGRGHLSVLEHGNAVVHVKDLPSRPNPGELLAKLLPARGGYHRIHSSSGGTAAAGNLRSWLESLELLERSAPSPHRFFAFHLHRFFPRVFPEAPDPGEYPHEARLVKEDEQLERLREDPASDLPVFTFKFVCDRGISHEVVRHRVLSFTQESTRYVNYGRRGMTFVLPEELEPFYDPRTEDWREEGPPVRRWLSRARTFFTWYREDLERGLKPQTARDVLPNLLKTELFVSGRWSGWEHFVRLRESPGAHPRIRFLAAEVRKYFESLRLF